MNSLKDIADRIEIRRSSITDLDTDAIVNAANEALLAGGGVWGAIFEAAGYQQMQEACNALSPCATGSAVITPGFRLPARYVIHAVGPVWIDGEQGEAEQLKSTSGRSSADRFRGFGRGEDADRECSKEAGMK